MRFRALASVALAIAVVAVGSAAAVGGALGASTHRAGVRCPKSKNKRRANHRCKAKKPVKKPPATPPNSVAIEGYAFHPGVLTVRQGTAVTWLFRDHGIAHWVVSDTESLAFQSSPQTSGSLTVSFPQPGTFNYSCALHTWMTGEIVVTAGAG